MHVGKETNERHHVKFCVQSSEVHRRDYLRLIPLTVTIILALWYIDPGIKNDLAWMLGGLAVGFVLIETAPLERCVEISVEVGPLGVQRTSKINDQVTHHQLLPRACVKDCIITEHVKAFSVNSSLVFRLDSSIVPVFPDAKLNFRQCELLLNQIQRALREQ